jgi:cellulose synthase (UDP-forming)
MAAALVCIVTVPLDLRWQAVSGVAALSVAILLKRRGGRRVSLGFMALSLIFSCRYIYWRLSTTLPVGTDYNFLDFLLGIGLLVAEGYAFVVLVLGYFQVLWPLGRKPVPLPADPALWPVVDIFIPTYNEPLQVVRPTVLAALELDWPPEKLRVYLLDDGRRDEFKDFCASVGAVHLTRADNKHAKAGNINRALAQTHGEYIAIFDCDHIPTRSFLQMTLGCLVSDPKMALVQTPHHFFSPDPFERNLKTFRRVPNEGELFYGLLQDGNDFWNATFFCGSCAVVRRTAIQEIGGIAVETVTEDAHTALRLHSKGWHSAYINFAQAAGLATESLSAHVGQRIRWARGMAQILRVDNPFFTPGLSWGQRLCYFNAMLHFLYGIPRLIFLTAPLAYLLFGIQIIHAQGLLIFAYAAPHVLLAITTNSRLQGRYRHSFWAEVYETVLAFFIIAPTTLALVNPKLGKFNVTAKGGLVDRDYFDGNIAKPYYILFFINIVGMVAGTLKLIFAGAQLADTIALNMVWTTYNILIVGACMCVASEARQLRRHVRVKTGIPVALKWKGEVQHSKTIDLSYSGAQIAVTDHTKFNVGDVVEVALIPSAASSWIKGTVRLSRPQGIALEFLSLSIAEEKQVIYALFGRADAWLGWRIRYREDQPLKSFGEVAYFSMLGSARFLRWMSQSLSKLPGQLARRMAGPVAAILFGYIATSFVIPELAQAAETDALPKSGEMAANEVVQQIKLEDLGQRYPIRLQTVFGQASVPFSVRHDQVVTKARLHLKYSHSPSLLPNLSSLSIVINDEPQLGFALTQDNENGAEKIVDINPALLGEFNQLRFEAAQHYTTDCEDPAYTSLWTVISNRSYLELTLAPLASMPALSLLPRPFFDPADNRLLSLPIVFASPNPNRDVYSAAAIVASWFGSQADYRGAEFPVQIGALPKSNAVVFRLGAAHSEYWGSAASSPRLRVVTHPERPQARLLLLEAPDEAGLVAAAQALVLGAYTVEGDSAEIRSVELPKPAAASVGPRWVDPDHPFSLKSIAGDQPLSVQGLMPAPMNLSFRLPPDIHFLGNDGAILDLGFRYSPATAPGSSLNVFLNDGLVGSVLLDRAGKAGASDGTRLAERLKIYLPATRLETENRLSIQYILRRAVTKTCDEFNPKALTGSIDPDSDIRLENFMHYSLWPDLGRLREAGFPFSTHADLSHTALIVPDKASEDALSAMLTMAGHLGHMTGSAALHLIVDTVSNAEEHSARDLLIVGHNGDLESLSAWQEKLPLQFTAEGAKLRSYGTLSRWQALVE